MRKECTCGKPLPLHMFNIAKKSFPEKYSHVCLCERKWIWNGDLTDIIPSGMEVNPAARVDEKIASGEISLDEVPKC